MAAMRASLTAKAGLVQPLPARVATFKPASCSRRSDLVARASYEKSAQHLASLGAAATAAEERLVEAADVVVKATNKCREIQLKSAAIGLGLAVASMLPAQQAQAFNEVAELAIGDNRLLILGVIFVPALGWVAFNILGPALNQYANMGDANKTKGKK